MKFISTGWEYVCAPYKIIVTHRGGYLAVYNPRNFKGCYDYTRTQLGGHPTLQDAIAACEEHDKWLRPKAPKSEAS